MSTKGSTKSTQSGLRNSFHVLSTLEDPADKAASKVNKTQANGTAAPKATVAAAKEEVSRPVANKPASTNGSSGKAAKAAVQQQKEVKSETKKVVQTAKTGVAAPAPAQNSGYPISHERLPLTVSCSISPLIKMLVFALLMLILPLAAYYWSVHQAGLDLGEIKSALIAVLVVNVLLFLYILLAFLEDSKAQKNKKD